MPQIEKVLTLGQVARLTRVSKDRLGRACDLGRVPHSRLPSGYPLISATVARQLSRHGLEAFPVRRERIFGEASSELLARWTS